MYDRTLQGLVKLVLEPEWEAHFESNSYGFRPGRSCHDAIEAIFNSIRHKPKFVLDADISQCFDRVRSFPSIWDDNPDVKAGVNVNRAITAENA